MINKTQTKNRNIIVSIFFVALTLLSCKKEQISPEVMLPTNFTTNISIDEGEVEIVGTANGANFYSFTFIEGIDSTTIESVEGKASYTYTSGGSHKIISRAHALHAEFVEITDIIEIEIEEQWSGGIPTTGYSSPLSYPGLTLVWHDEFDGAALSSDWVYETGTGSWGWGNNELQYYRSENVAVNDGLLIITAKEEYFGGQNYTSGRIKTQGRQSFQEGRIDIRAALPYGKGIWPALWMLGNSITSIGWPACGEIDIMELIGGEGYNDKTIYGTIHWDNDGSHASFGGSSTLLNNKYAEEFHVFSIIWTNTSIKWLRDDIQYNEADISPAQLSEFHNNFFFIFNVAVGGNWPGSPDATTLFPQTMAVDYVRVFQ